MSDNRSRGRRRIFYWDWIKHEDTLYYSRINFFLVGQGMLLTAYASMLGVAKERQTFLLAMSGLGAALSAVTITISLYIYFFTSRPIWNRLRKITPEYAEVDRKRIRFPASGALLGGLMPLLFLLLWLYFAYGILTPDQWVVFKRMVCHVLHLANLLNCGV